jgi:hypothetical protein
MIFEIHQKAKRLKKLSQGFYFGAKFRQNGKQTFGAASLPKGFLRIVLTRIAKKFRVWARHI